MDALGRQGIARDSRPGTLCQFELPAERAAGPLDCARRLRRLRPGLFSIPAARRIPQRAAHRAHAGLRPGQIPRAIPRVPGHPAARPLCADAPRRGAARGGGFSARMALFPGGRASFPRAGGCRAVHPPPLASAAGILRSAQSRLGSGGRRRLPPDPPRGRPSASRRRAA